MAENLGLETGDDLDAEAGKQNDLKIGEKARNDHRADEQKAVAVHQGDVAAGDTFVHDGRQDQRIDQLQRGGEQHGKQPEAEQSQVLFDKWKKEPEIVR